MRDILKLCSNWYWNLFVCYNFIHVLCPCHNVMDVLFVSYRKTVCILSNLSSVSCLASDRSKAVPCWRQCFILYLCLMCWVGFWLGKGEDYMRAFFSTPIVINMLLSNLIRINVLVLIWKVKQRNNFCIKVKL